MARYQVDKSRYEELLIGTTITNCSIGSEEIVLDPHSDRDLILIIDKTGSFWRIRNSDTIIGSAHMVLPTTATKQSFDDDELDSYAQLETRLEEANKTINDSITGKKIVEIKVADFDLMLQFVDGIIFEVFKSKDLEDNLPNVSLLTGIKD